MFPTLDTTLAAAATLSAASPASAAAATADTGMDEEGTVPSSRTVTPTAHDVVSVRSSRRRCFCRLRAMLSSDTLHTASGGMAPRSVILSKLEYAFRYQRMRKDDTAPAPVVLWVKTSKSASVIPKSCASKAMAASAAVIAGASDRAEMGAVLPFIPVISPEPRRQRANVSPSPGSPVTVTSCSAGVWSSKNLPTHTRWTDDAASPDRPLVSTVTSGMDP
mmetsp:Transcript_61009/g.83782  ORF Transcript_61009/g.83782 Transcript_61009/m.83782 type:complete len:220 (+) Transcript_61009:1554-2213(+)